MISYELILYCILSAGVFLLVVSILTDWLTKKFNLLASVPETMKEKTDMAGFGVNFLMELLFMAVIPTLGYSFFYLIIPMAGVRGGLAVALIAFSLGVVPILMILSLRIRLPMLYLLFLMLTQIIKLGGALAIIGYLYSL